MYLFLLFGFLIAIYSSGWEFDHAAHYLPQRTQVMGIGRCIEGLNTLMLKCLIIIATF